MHPATPLTDTPPRPSVFKKAFIQRLLKAVGTQRDTVAIIPNFLVTEEKSKKADVLMAHFGTSTILTAFTVQVTRSHWEKTVAKAKKDRNYANRSVIAVPSRVLENALEHLGELKEHGIGLWEIPPDGSIIRHSLGKTGRALNPEAYKKMLTEVSTPKIKPTEH